MGQQGGTGSPRVRGNKPSHLIVGRILAPHGVAGDVEVEMLTDFPHRFSLLKAVYVGQDLEPTAIEGQRAKKHRIIIKLRGCDDRDRAGQLRGEYIRVPIDQAMPLDEGEYYLHQIVGLEVWTDEGEFLGRVNEILFTGSNEVYVVSNGENEVLIPAISEVVTGVDLGEGRITVRLMKGLR